MQPEAYKAAVTTLAKNNKVPIAPPNSPPESDNVLTLLLNQKRQFYTGVKLDERISIAYPMFCST